MAKRGRRTGGRGKGSAAPAAASRRFSPDRRLVLRSSVAALALGGAGWALHRHDAASRRRHDLGAIGAGRPVVVQVHDPSCPMCRRLMAATETALEAFPGVEYRVADLTESAGREFGERHRASKVTLVLFDARGRRVRTLEGVRTPEALTAAFDVAFGASARAAAADAAS